MDKRLRSGSSKLDKDKQGQFMANKVHPGKRNKEKMDTVVMNQLDTARSQSNEGEDQNLLYDNEQGEDHNQKTQMSLLQKLQAKGIKQVAKDYIQEVRNYEFFISHSSSFKENWDFLIMITACYNVFMLPIGIAFRVENQVFDLTSQAVDIVFVLDIFIVFRTTILDDDSGEEIRDGKIIASKYLKGRFTVDFLSTVPFDYIALVSIGLRRFLSSFIFSMYFCVFSDEFRKATDSLTRLFSHYRFSWIRPPPNNSSSSGC